jgi:hypothetical protein
MDHLFTRGPRKNCEASILRRDQRQRITLIVHKLRRREMSRAAMLCRLDHDWKIPYDRLSNDPLVNRWITFLSTYLGAKRKHFILVVDDSCPIDRSHSADRVYHAPQSAFPLPSIFFSNFTAYQFR